MKFAVALCRVETASTCDFDDSPQGEIERDGGNATQNRWHSLPTRETRAALSEAHGSTIGFIHKVSTYLQCSYVSLTTMTRGTLENGEGSNACALPCGVGGVGRGVSDASAMRKEADCRASAHARLTLSQPFSCPSRPSFARALVDIASRVPSPYRNDARCERSLQELRSALASCSGGEVTGKS